MFMFIIALPVPFRQQRKNFFKLCTTTKNGKQGDIIYEKLDIVLTDCYIDSENEPSFTKLVRFLNRRGDAPGNSDQQQIIMRNGA